MSWSNIRWRKINKFFLSLVSPVSKNKDFARREFILNILLLGSLFLTTVACLKTWIEMLISSDSNKLLYLGSSISVTIILIFFLLGYFLSKKGKSKIISYIIIVFYLFVNTQSLYIWGAGLPTGLLTYSLIVVMSGILINSRFAFLVTILISLIIMTLIQLQKLNIITSNYSWINVLPTIGDGIIYSSLFFIIASVSWLFNREMERALKRAKNSELALIRERDSLEIKVVERTEQLKQAQIEKMAQMYRFVEFGRVSSGLFHDLLTPLTLISLNLENLQIQTKNKQIKEIEAMHESVKRATYGTKKLELFINAARKQLQHSQKKKLFRLSKVVEEVVKLLNYRIKTEGIKISFEQTDRLTTYGNPLQFQQVITNLLNNAIDAFQNVKRKGDSKITIELYRKNQQIHLTVKDNGIGIRKDKVNKIFDPLFTTKSANTNMGLGLSLTKDIIEKDFQGKIKVKTEINSGTMFHIIFPQKSKNIAQVK